MSIKQPTLYLIIPCYNEQDVLETSTKQILEQLQICIKKSLISNSSKILFINDGSKDNTWQIMTALSKSSKYISAISLSKNAGHQNALLAGLMTAKDYADITISMDVDLQDDIFILDKFIQEYKNGNEIVYGIRSQRKKDTFFKRNTAQFYYSLLKFFGINIYYNHADYRLMSKKSLQALSKFEEVNLFLRGLVPLLGFQTTTIFYVREERLAGESKYSLIKMLSLAMNGITAFSVRPIRLILLLGVSMFTVSLGFLIYIFIVHSLKQTVPGWSFLTCSLWLLGGIQLLSLGIIGEYIGRIYQETKKRPLYFIDKTLNIGQIKTAIKKRSNEQK